MDSSSKLMFAQESARNGNIEEALSIFEKLIQEENNEDGAAAAYCLGILYEGGIGVQEDKQNAIKYYKIAEERGDAMAVYRIAIILQYYKNLPEAMEKYRKIAQINPSAAWRTYLIMKDLGDRFSSVESRKYLDMAAGLGHVRAKRELLSPKLKGEFGIMGRISAIGALCSIMFETKKIVKNGEKIKYT